MRNFRPKLLSDIIGQNPIKKYLSISIDAARKKNGPISHMLFSGPSGLGKTSLALAIANEMGRPIQLANGAKIGSAKFLAPYLTRAQENSILFIDEVHRLNKATQEFLYPVLEDSKIILSTENSTIDLDLPPFTIFVATTNTGALAEPFQNRFGVQFNLEYYKEDDLCEIGKINLESVGISCPSNIIEQLCRRTKQNPRILNNFINWLDDYCTSNGNKSLDVNNFFKAMDIIGVDSDGYNSNDRKYLKLLSEQYGEPIGLTTIASILNIGRDTITNFIEPYLLKTKIIRKVNRGRVLRKVI